MTSPMTRAHLVSESLGAYVSSRQSPGVAAIFPGTAEAMPLPDASVDAVRAGIIADEAKARRGADPKALCVRIGATMGDR
jgi:hypothetical protein